MEVGYYLVIFSYLAIIANAQIGGFRNYLDELPTVQSFRPITNPVNNAFGQLGSKYYLEDLLNINREIDGSKNNIQNPQWGAASAITKRMSGKTTSYEDYIGQPVNYLPSPREISNQIGQLKTFQPNKQNINLLFVIWGQFLDHDIIFTPQQHGQTSEHMNIHIPKGDPFFDKDSKGNQQMNFSRSAYQMINGVRSTTNSITAWVDAGTIYGSNQQLASKLRSHQNGKLKQSEFNMLPKDSNGKFFQSGDVRANENFALTSMHTLFMRQHNRLCDEIIQYTTNLSDEQIYQMARHYVIGLIQKITFNDFMPKLLGPAMYQQYFSWRSKYDKNIQPDIMLQMATGLFRVGHTLLNDDFSMKNQKGQILKKFALKDAFARPDVFDKDTVLDDIFMGLMHTPAKQKNCQVIDSIRNFLAIDAKNRQHKLDLFSLNLQRGRDHGLLSYGDLRGMFGLNPLSFYDICPKQQDAAKLSKIYRNPNEMDLWLGTICQKPVQKGVMGQLGSKALGYFFSKLKYGDRFYFQWAYPQRIVDEIKKTSLSDIIARNTKLNQMPLDTFEVMKDIKQIRQETIQNNGPMSLALQNYYKKWMRFP